MVDADLDEPLREEVRHLAVAEVLPREPPEVAHVHLAGVVDAEPRPVVQLVYRRGHGRTEATPPGKPVASPATTVVDRRPRSRLPVLPSATVTEKGTMRRYPGAMAPLTWSRIIKRTGLERMER